jgi:hypothetical protein
MLRTPRGWPQVSTQVSILSGGIFAASRHRKCFTNRLAGLKSASMLALTLIINHALKQMLNAQRARISEWNNQ